MLEEGNANGVKKRQRPTLLSEDVLDQFSLGKRPQTDPETLASPVPHCKAHLQIVPWVEWAVSVLISVD